MKTWDMIEIHENKHGRKRFKTDKEFHNFAKSLIFFYSETPIKSIKDDGGTCLICGEDSRCTGWHVEGDRVKWL